LPAFHGGLFYPLGFPFIQALNSSARHRNDRTMAKVFWNWAMHDKLVT